MKGVWVRSLRTKLPNGSHKLALYTFLQSYGIDGTQSPFDDAEKERRGRGRREDAETSMGDMSDVIVHGIEWP